MNTYRIYEEFKATFGDAAAQSLAKTLGTMFEELKDTVTKEDFRILRESIDANGTRLDGTMLHLAEGQSQLFEAQTRTEVKVAELADGQSQLFEAQTCTERELKALAEAMQRLTIRTDSVIGDAFEIRLRDRLTAYLGRFLRRGKVVGNDTLLDAIEPRISPEEADDFLRADIVAKGLVDGVETYVVVEVSSTGDTTDIVRAEQRAEILRKAGLAAIPLVACDAILPESLVFAGRRGVRIWCNGSLVDAAA